MYMAAYLLSLAICASGQSQVRVELDHSRPVRPLPSYLGNPTDAPEITMAGDGVTLRVVQAGRGMKFELPLKPFDPGVATYLVVRYRAENLGPGYAFWVVDGTPGGHQILSTDELTRDGQWHTLALDMEARGVDGTVRALLTEVQCGGAPAAVTYADLYLTDEIPEGATVIPPPSPPGEEVTLRPATLAGRLRAEPTWLPSPAERYAAVEKEGVLHLSAEGAGKGMKWSVMLTEPVDLRRFRYVAVRYRARNTLPWGDYLVWMGSGEGGMPEHAANLVSLAQLRADDAWHVVIARLALKQPFTAVNLAMQVSSAGDRGEVWIDTIRFTTDRPLLDIADVVPVSVGWADLRAPEPEFTCVRLGNVANAPVQPRLRRLGLKSWLPEGKVTVRGIPFDLLGGERNVLMTPADIDQTAEVPVGAQADEVFLLWAARLPSRDASRIGDPIPMEHFSTPERFVVRVEYEDGAMDEIFPVSVASGEPEVRRGIEVYCLPQLRRVPVRRLLLRNRMESGSFLLAGVTLHTGTPLIPPPAVLALPGLVPAREEDCGVGRITPVPGGYTIENSLLRLELQTVGGVRLKRIANRCLQGAEMTVQAGPLFEMGDGQKLLTSEQVAVGSSRVETRGPMSTLRVALDGSPGGVPLRGELILTVGGGPDILMQLDLAHVGAGTMRPVVNFPLLRGLRIGEAEDTWYLWTCKGGIINNRPTHQRHTYGGEHPLQVSDVFSPAAGGGLALLTYDLDDVYRWWDLVKDETGVSWRMDYWPHEHEPGERVEVAPTALRAHTGDWRRALGIYRDWARTWYKPQVPRKDWFRGVFYYQQVFAWNQLYDPQKPDWPMAELINRYRDYFGCLDYLHIFDFGESRVYGRVGDYNHYEELGGLPMMQRAIAKAQEMGVPVGLYIEGYLCDERAAWGKEKVLRNDVRDEKGNSRLWSGTTEHVMCGAAAEWREHLTECYRRAATDLRPNGMYIDEYGFIGPWYICYSREHGHPVPWPPIRGERDTTRAIRAAVPESIATLTEETPNDVNSQYQDGALAYSVTQSDPTLTPHRTNLFRFVFPSFKTFQLVSYNTFLEGGWDLLKWPFFNGEGLWLHGGTSDFYCEDAHQFLRKAFAILNRYEDAFCSDDVEPLVPTLRPTVYANRFSGPHHTVWTLFNGEWKTFRGDLLRVPHREGMRYVEAFTGKELPVSVGGGLATIRVEIGPQGVGCVVQER